MRRNSFFASVFLASCFHPETFEEKLVRYQSMSYQEMIQEIHTPDEVRWYIRNYITPEEDPSFAAPFQMIHAQRKGDCSEAVVAAAALLSDDGYPPQVLFLRSPLDPQRYPRHLVFVYEEKNLWGSLGINDADIQYARFSTLEELALQFPFEEYSFQILPVEKFPGWVSGSDNLNVHKKFFALSHPFQKVSR